MRRPRPRLPRAGRADRPESRRTSRRSSPRCPPVPRVRPLLPGLASAVPLRAAASWVLLSAGEALCAVGVVSGRASWVAPLGSRAHGSADECARRHGSDGPPRGHDCPRTGAGPRTRVSARRQTPRSRIPHDTTTALAHACSPPRSTKSKTSPVITFCPLIGHRAAGLLLLHPTPAAQGAGGPPGPAIGTSMWATKSRPWAASSVPSSRSTATATRC